MDTTITLYDKIFTVKNIARKQWQTEYNCAIATKGTSRIEVIDLLKVYDKEKLLSACDMVDKNRVRDTFFKGHITEFKTIFGFDAPRDYMMYLIGCGLTIDVIKLDEKLHTPDGISTNDYILQKYGEHALSIVKQMI